MKTIKNFESFNEAVTNGFKPSSIMWNRKPIGWDKVNRSILLSHLSDKSREDLINNHIKGNIYDSIEYQMSYPNKDFGDIWGGGSAPRYLVVRYEGNFYLVDTEGYDYAKYVVRIDDLDRWVDIEENLY